MAQILKPNGDDLLIGGATLDLDQDPELKENYNCPKCNQRIKKLKQKITENLLWADKHTPEIFDSNNYHCAQTGTEKYSTLYFIINFFKEQERYRISKEENKNIDVEKEKNKCSYTLGHLSTCINIANIIALRAKNPKVQKYWVEKISSLSKERAIDLG